MFHENFDEFITGKYEWFKKKKRYIVRENLFHPIKLCQSNTQDKRIDYVYKGATISFLEKKSRDDNYYILMYDTFLFVL